MKIEDRYILVEYAENNLVIIDLQTIDNTSKQYAEFRLRNQLIEGRKAKILRIRKKKWKDSPIYDIVTASLTV